MKKAYWAISSAALLIAAFAAGAYFYLHAVPKRQPGPVNFPAGENPAPAASSTPPVVLNEATKPLPVTQDKYGLFVVTPTDRSNSFTPEAKYQDDGLVENGKYQGYHRLAAFVTADDPSGGASYIFATKDYQTFILDTGTTPPYVLQNFASAESGFNKTKVTATDEVPVNHPAEIAAGNFVLVRNGISWDALPAGSLQLSSSVPNLDFFALPLANPENYGNTDRDFLDFAAIRKNYLQASADVYVRDRVGLTFSYQFRSVESHDRALSETAGQPVNYPSLAYQYFYKKSDFTSNASTYENYGQVLIYGCASPTASSYVLKNIQESDLVKIARTARGVDLYAFKDKNFPLNRGEYYAKVLAAGQWFKDVNKVDPPGQSQYAANSPVLVFKDPWDRWIGLGEVDYLLAGGCGKPVIYLYPQKPTEVKVQFVRPMNLSLAIPALAGQWDVLASPDGKLLDLKPQATDCSKLDFTEKGLGYAEAGCRSGVYPYLFWAGQAMGDYPKADGGWVVPQSELAVFLEQRLSEIGLNKKERQDMAEYWVPELLAKGAPYYRMAFFQTAQMNDFVPMQVSPRPDTVIRVFLDWAPLTSKPLLPPKAQALRFIARQGFTLVEWGGLKR